MWPSWGKPEMPKRPMSAYMLWLNSNRDSIKAQNPGLKVSEIAKKGGEIWRALDKTEWEEKAAKAKEQYEKELAIYNANRGVIQEPDEYDVMEECGYCSSCDYTDYEDEHNNPFLNAERNYYNARQGGAKKTTKIKLKKAAKAKRQNGKYRAIKNANKRGKASQKPVKDKEQCESCGSSDESDYEYRPNKRPPSRNVNVNKTKKTKLKINKPKRPMPAYMIWLNSSRESIKAENPGLKVIEITRIAGEMWRAMEDKSEWEEKAAKANEQYYRDLYKYSVDGSGDEKDHRRACKALMEKEQNQQMTAIEEPSYEITLFEPQKITCSYKTTGCLYPQESGFMYVPETPVHISFEDILNVKVAREASSTQPSFDLEILLKSGAVHTFNSINEGEYEKLIDHITSRNVHIKNENPLHDDAELKYGAQEYLNTEAEENQSKKGDAKPAMESGVAEVKKEILTDEEIYENV